MQQGFMSVLLHFASPGSGYVVEGFIHLGDDMKAVKDVESVGASLANHAQVGLPRVGADELDFRGEFFPEHGEESLEGFYGSFFTHPEQAGGAGVDLIDQGEVFVALGKLDLVDPDGRGAML
jgi:hypothetical protein